MVVALDFALNADCGSDFKLSFICIVATCSLMMNVLSSFPIFTFRVCSEFRRSNVLMVSGI